jgi:hypothetical protein
MANGRDQIMMAAGFYSQRTEPALLAVEGDPLHQAGKDLGAGRRVRHDLWVLPD